jgi:8-oxo-dGTP pyrophosphatase MutT (NUDIX family)
MNEVTTAGGIVVEEGLILLIRHGGGGLGFAKGHIEEGESLETAAVREVGEETAYVVEIVKYLGSLERLSTEKSGEVVKKKIELYLMSMVGNLNTPPEEGPEWVKLSDAVSNMQFPEEAVFLEQHRNVFI